ncbi:MAG: cytochrome c3 family protein [Deferrisomatales bacterium]
MRHRVAWFLAAVWTATALAEPLPITGSHATLECVACHSGDAPKDCDGCHDPRSNIHPVGVAPNKALPPEFVLGPEGLLLCRSCHRLHGGDPASRYLAQEGGDRAAFCVRCHGLEMARVNPHQARQGTTRCAYCHASTPEIQTGEARIKARADIVRLCDFCHGAVAKDHPRNIDPTISLPKGLPLGQDGKWTCVTCHNPHGTTSTTHYVRPEFAKHFERGRQDNPHVESYFACKACHRSAVAAEIKAPDYQLRYKGDLNVLCVSCHVTERGHHPTGLRLPEFMAADLAASQQPLPLDREGRITCYTCHDNGCSSGHQRMTERHYDRRTLRNDLCWSCHRKDEFSRINPHVEDPKLCAHCHESLPTVGGGKTGLVTVPKMVCLRCHEVKPHPAGADHLREPSKKIKPDESLRLGPNGDVTCTTCHDPHGSPDPKPRRLRVTGTDICGLCHWRK